MNKYSRVYKFSMGLLTTASCLVMLPACTSSEEWSKALSGDSRPKQRVSTNRHAPMLNPRTASMPQAQMQQPMQAPMVTQVQQPPKSSGEVTPFDRYDAYGNEVDPAAQQQAKPAQQQAGEEPGFFDRFMTPKSDMSAPATAAKPAPVPSNAVRKPLNANPYYSSANTPVPLPPAESEPVPMKVMKATPVTKSDMKSAAQAETMQESPRTVTPLLPMVSNPADEPRAMVIEQQQPPAPVEQMPWDTKSVANSPAAEPAGQAVAESPAATNTNVAQKSALPPVAPKEPSFFSRMMGNFYNGNGEEAAEQAQQEPIAPDDMGQPVDYPTLASVPPTPQQFKSVEHDKQQNMEQLQSDYMQSQREKQMINAEPSQLANTPLEAPPLPLQESSAAPKAAAVEAPQGGAVLLGHVAEPLSPQAPVPPVPPMQPVVAEGVSQSNQLEPITPPASDMPIISEAEAAQGKPGDSNSEWWKRWRLFSNKDEEAAEEAAAQPPAAAVASPSEPPAMLPPISSMPPQQPVPSSAAQPAPQLAQPPISPTPTPLLAPSAAPAAAPKATVARADEASKEDMQAQDKAAAGLPSPEILRNTKMLPASRYQTRERATHPASSY